MKFQLPSLALITASSFLDAQALESKPEPGLLSRSLKLQRSPLPTCTYTPSKIREPSRTENHYVFSIDLPGESWAAVCSRSEIVDQWLNDIEVNCDRVWCENGLTRILEKAKATSEGALCRVTFTVVTEPEEDWAFPDFSEDCILNSKLDTCGLAEEHFPWPETCSQVAVGLPNCLPDFLQRIDS